MARLRSITTVAGTGRIHPTEVDAEISVAIAVDGQRYVQISTFGSDNRATGPKVSQTIQINEQLAAQLSAHISFIFSNSES